MENPQLWVGVDGGATKTDAVVLDANGHIVGRGTAGPSNAYTVGRRTAVRNIRLVIRMALGTKLRYVRAVGMGLAGIDTTADHTRMSRALRPLLRPLVGTRFLVVNDIHAGYATGVTQPYGAAVIAGTGSNAYARGRNGTEAYASGLNTLLSDDGSAYAIGRALLRAAVQSADGRIPHSRLERLVLRYFRVHTMRALVPVVHHSSFRKADIAHLAPLADVAAGRGDRTARRILEAAAGDLVTMVRAVTKRTALARSAFELVLIGGVFNGTIVRRTFERDVRRFSPHVRFIRPAVPFAVGAARLARQRWA